MPATDVSSRLIPILLRWQGLLKAGPATLHRLEQLAGCILFVQLGGLPFFTRSGLALLLLSSGLLWVLWSLATPAAAIDKITMWLLIILGVAVLATGVTCTDRSDKRTVETPELPRGLCLNPQAADPSSEVVGPPPGWLALRWTPKQCSCSQAALCQH